MSYSPKIAVKSEALTVAMNAKIGSLDAETVDALRQKAEEYLTSDQPLFRAIMEFATHYPLVCRDPDALFARGETLHQVVIVENNNDALQDDFAADYGGF